MRGLTGLGWLLCENIIMDMRMEITESVGGSSPGALKLITLPAFEERVAADLMKYHRQLKAPGKFSIEYVSGRIFRILDQRHRDSSAVASAKLSSSSDAFEIARLLPDRNCRPSNINSRDPSESVT